MNKQLKNIFNRYSLSVIALESKLSKNYLTKLKRDKIPDSITTIDGITVPSRTVGEQRIITGIAKRHARFMGW